MKKRNIKKLIRLTEMKVQLKKVKWSATNDNLYAIDSQIGTSDQ